MSSRSSSAIRTLALLGHAGSGKTSLLERLLLASGAKGEVGTVEKGDTLSDFEPLEKQYGHSLDTALARIDHDGHEIQLIDTPGDPDFRGPALAAMSATRS